MKEYIKKVNNEYYSMKNVKIDNNIILDKIKKIYIPPAYKDVKIYIDQDVLATGVDKAGRTQYIYSENRKIERERKKFCQLISLGDNVVKLQKKINKDIMEANFSKNKIIALILKIMNLCNFRSGNKKYEEMYGSYGLTTLHKKHIILKKDFIEINFIGKKGVNNNCLIKDKQIQSIIRNVYKLSNKRNPYIFSIMDNKNEVIDVSINDLNRYLDEFNITSKDLRTWNANIIFLKNLRNSKEVIIKKVIKDAIAKTAISLHHTPTVCKNSYLYKDIIKQIESGIDQRDIQGNPFLSKIYIKNINFETFLIKLLRQNKEYKKC